MKNFILLVVFSSFFKVLGQGYEKKLFINENDTLPYRILLPQKIIKGEKYPLVIFLHGIGERGNDNELQLIHGSTLFLKENNLKKFPSYVIFPQCPIDSTWPKLLENTKGIEYHLEQYSNNPKENKTLELLEKLIKFLTDNSQINTSKIYVGGLSMGGMGTYELVYRNPFLFAAAFSICGAANPSIARKLSYTNWKIFHGDSDVVVPVTHSINMFDSIKTYSSNVSLKIYPGVNHNSWENVFEEPDFLNWLYSNEKK